MSFGSSHRVVNGCIFLRTWVCTVTCVYDSKGVNLQVSPAFSLLTFDDDLITSFHRIRMFDQLLTTEESVCEDIPVHRGVPCSLTMHVQ